MSKNRIIVTSVVIEGRPKAAVARDYGVSYRWVHTLITRYLTDGWDAIEPQSRRPKTSPSRTPPNLEAEIIQLRRSLQAAGHDAGPHTIAAHLERAHGVSPAVSTIWKVLRRNNLIAPQPKKRPRSSYLRFEADLPNETWQSDFTHWRLASGTGVEILTFLDDHSRLALSVTAYPVLTVALVLHQFRATAAEYGPPASTLTDNGLVFTTRVRGGKNAFENELRLLNITQKNGRPNHPQTQGKVERFQQTLKRWLTAQPPTDTIEDLQTQLNTFRDYYNTIRPHRSLKHMTPEQAYSARSKIGPAGTVGGHWRIRDDRIDNSGVITIRYNSKMHHIGIGRAHQGTKVRVLIHDRHIRVINKATGTLLRELTLNPDIDYQRQTKNTPTE